MIPSFVVVKWRHGQKFGIPLPIFIAWPLILLVFMIAGIVQLATPKHNRIAAQALLAVEGFSRSRGFRLDIKSKDTNFSISVI